MSAFSEIASGQAPIAAARGRLWLWRLMTHCGHWVDQCHSLNQPHIITLVPLLLGRHRSSKEAGCHAVIEQQIKENNTVGRRGGRADGDGGLHVRLGSRPVRSEAASRRGGSSGRGYRGTEYHRAGSLRLLSWNRGFGRGRGARHRMWDRHARSAPWASLGLLPVRIWQRRKTDFRPRDGLDAQHIVPDDP